MNHRPGQHGIRTIEVEASAWIAQLSGGKFSEADRAALREWCSRSPGHRDALKNLAGIWAELDALAELPAELPSKRSKRVEPSRLKWSPFWLAHAGALVMAVVGVAVWMADFGPRDVPVELYATEVGAQRTIELADRSTVHLNTNSLLEVDYGDRERRFRLVKGEALFEVVEDPDRPFTVYAATSSIQAIGTRFSVRFLSDDIQVIVTEGRVAVARSGAADVLDDQPVDSSILESQQLAIINDGPAGTVSIRELEAAEIQRRLSWTTGVLDFDGEPLVDVIAEVSRYTSLKIRIDQPELGQRPVGGRFRIGETEALFDVIEAGFAAKVVHNEDVVVITVD